MYVRQPEFTPLPYRTVFQSEGVKKEKTENNKPVKTIMEGAKKIKIKFGTKE